MTKSLFSERDRQRFAAIARLIIPAGAASEMSRPADSQEDS